MQQERRCSCAREEDVSFRDVKKKKSQIEKMTRGMWMTSCTGSVRGGFWGIWEKSVSRVLAPEEDSDFRSSPRPCGECCTWCVCVWGGADGKVVIERLCLSLPYVEKPFNSKVIKSFVRELRNRQVFFVFRDSYVIYIWVMNVLCTSMNMSISHNHVWLCNNYSIPVQDGRHSYWSSFKLISKK